jgi:phosphoribosylanthranilate isomerase
LCDSLLLDTSVKGHSGGTGTPFNWTAATPDIREIERELPVVLAGGLKPGNVAAAIEQIHPWAVDVSSGVEESPGVKSHELMSAFAKAVRSASIV